MNAKRVVSKPYHSAARRPMAMLGALLATVLSSNAQAVDIPAVPLQSGAAFPPANVMFILDDSGSMEFYAMPHDVSSRFDTSDDDGLDETLLDKYSGQNTIYYNPATTYRAWMKADNTRHTSGLSYTSAWDHPSLLSTSINLSNNTQTWFVPKSGATDLTNINNFFRYQIRTVGGSSRVVRSESIPPFNGSGVLPGYPRNGLGATSGGMGNLSSFTIPTGTTQMVVTLSGGTHGDNGAANNSNGNGPDLYIRSGTTDPTTATFTQRSTGNGNSETITVTNPTVGEWRVGINRASNYLNVTMSVSITLPTDPLTGEANAGCSTATSGTTWRRCTFSTPTGRTEAQERTNFTTWYSYHSTRMKVAKAGASEAFSQIGSNLRIGYNSIWNRSPFDIPVGTSNGQFTGTNKSTWYTRLHDANGSDGTPLKGALQRAGNYYSDDDGDGPWGPEVGDRQLSCRQSFAILTTDGYWNNNSGFTAVGDVDDTAGPTQTSADGETGGYAKVRPYIDNFSTSPSTQPNTLADVALHFWKNDLIDDLDNDVPTSSADPAFWQHMTTFGVSIGLKGNLDPENDLAAITNGSKRWGDPTNAEDADRIDDLWHASVNGRGSFVVASNTNEFAQGLLEAFSLVAQRLGSASNVTSNSTTLSTDTALFQASYVTGKWKGEVASFAASASGVAETATWLATARIAAATTRNFFTWNGTAGTTFPTSAQTTALDASGRVTGPVTGANNVAYIKGDQSLEVANDGNLRNRDTVLGDVVNSSPAYVRDTDTVYVGANDGMLHAFDADTGDELFNYIPGILNFAELSTLSNPVYVHKYFVDGPVVITSRNQTPGSNFLIGSLGRGGKGLFALDVTTPASFAADDVLWELTDAELGQVLGEPLIAKLNDVDGTRVVIVGNGINSTGGNAVLFVVDIESGDILFELNTGVAGDNGLFAPRGADNDGNGTVDFVYAGDRLGNLWKFDFRTGTPSIALGGEPLFTTDTGQPITAGLGLAKDPDTNKLWVFFGTGSFISSTDAADDTIQSVYGVIDEGTDTLTRDSLTERTIAGVATINGTRVRGFESYAAIDDGALGWFIDLDNPEAGERIINRPQLRGQNLLFSSIIPATDNTCDAGGSGFVNAISPFTGTTPESSPLFSDLDGDGDVDNDDLYFSPPGGGPPIAIGSIDLGVGQPTLPIVLQNPEGGTPPEPPCDPQTETCTPPCDPDTEDCACDGEGTGEDDCGYECPPGFDPIFVTGSIGETNFACQPQGGSTPRRASWIELPGD